MATQEKGQIHKLENAVLNNKSMIYLTRESVMENRAALLKNYEAAFNGNRQVANANTDAAFRNRILLIESNHSTDAVKTHFREEMINKSKLEFLDHRSKMNAKVNSISEEFAAINARLIAMNNEIMAANGDIIEFNRNIIAANSEIIQKGLPGWESCTNESNATLVAANHATISEISKRVETNGKANEKVYESVVANRTQIESNSATIQKRRSEILANQKHISENADKIIHLLK